MFQVLEVSVAGAEVSAAEREGDSEIRGVMGSPIGSILTRISGCQTDGASEPVW